MRERTEKEEWMDGWMDKGDQARSVAAPAKRCAMQSRCLLYFPLAFPKKAHSCRKRKKERKKPQEEKEEDKRRLLMYYVD